MGTFAGAAEGRGRSHSGRTGRDARWSRAWLLVKLALFAGAVYTGGCAFLGVGPQVPQLQLPRWARWLQARAARCLAAASQRYGGFAVSVEVRASAAVVLSSPSNALLSSSSSSSSSPPSDTSRPSFGSSDTNNKASSNPSPSPSRRIVQVQGATDKTTDSSWAKAKREGAKASRTGGLLSPASDKKTPRPPRGEDDAAKTAASPADPKPSDVAPVPAVSDEAGGRVAAGAAAVRTLTSTAASISASPGQAGKPARQPHAAPSSGENLNLRRPQKKGVHQQQQQQPSVGVGTSATSAAMKRDQGDDHRRRQTPPSATTGHQQQQQQQSRAVAAAAAPTPAALRSTQYVRRGNVGANVGVNVNVGGRGLRGSGALSVQQRKINAGRGSGSYSQHR